ncbi:MAG: hypothetical protein ACKVPJ_10730 [Chitinophagales bacterium]
MKIGVVLTFFDFRNDVRKVLEIMAYSNEVTVFARSEDQELISKQLPGKVGLRFIKEKIQNTRNTILERLFLLFKKLPKSSQNYFLMEAFKIQNNPNIKAQKKGWRILRLQKVLPKIFSYQQYIKLLQFSGKTEIDDIDKFFFLTEIYDDYFLARIQKEKKPATVYVYSWDHACKHTKFPGKIKYAVWNTGVGEDVRKLQHCNSEAISITGASQFGFIDEYRKKRHELKSEYSFQYLYFGCAIGIESIATKEVALIKQVAELLRRKYPDIKLVVRPYPVLRDWSLYDGLKSIDNIVLDDDFRSADLSVSEENIYLKYKKIEEAKAFLHIGTTLGLEACFLNTVSFILNFGYEDIRNDLYSFIHQYQNEKYLINQFPENCVNSLEEMEHVLANIDNIKYRRQNNEIQAQFPVYSFQTFAQNLINA